MDTTEFQQFASQAIDYIVNYNENLRNKPTLPLVEPGYLRGKLPHHPPQTGENWRSILGDLDRIIVPGLTHWQSPHFHAYYPTASSYPAIVGEFLMAGLGAISTDWHSNPAMEELEVKMMDWLGKLLSLPEYFLNCHQGPGGGVIQNSASESTLTALLAAKLGQKTSRLVAYTSEQSNSSVEKAGLLASVKMRLLPTDSEGALRGDTLLQAIRNDLSCGLTPCCVVATLGTTGTCSFDSLQEIGPICREFGIWLHIDAAYAGSALVCPEYRHLMNGAHFADSFTFNPHKWMLVNSDCSAMWFKDAAKVRELFKTGERGSKLQHLQLPTHRRFRALKLWFVLRIYGLKGVQKHVRHQISLANYLQSLLETDGRFQICVCRMGLVCFRVKGRQDWTQQVIDNINGKRTLFLMPYHYQHKLVIRFVICSRFTEKEDVDFAWRQIRDEVDKLPITVQ